jgi:phenylacetate-coenzyme A ligase PaaK-like adenylate-forming protein
VTTLGRDNPLIRYDLEEAAALLREECTCGETTIRGLWGGRFKDLLASQGKRFQVNELEKALRAIPEIAKPTLEYQVVKPKDEQAPLRIRVESTTAGDTEDVARKANAAINEELGIDTDIEVLPRDALPRSGYKATRLVDD